MRTPPSEYGSYPNLTNAAPLTLQHSLRAGNVEEMKRHPHVTEDGAIAE